MSRYEAIEQAAVVLQRQKLSEFGIAAQAWIDLGEALALPEDAEPVAFMCPDDPDSESAFQWAKKNIEPHSCDGCGRKPKPVYTHPPKAVDSAELVKRIDDWIYGRVCDSWQLLTDIRKHLIGESNG